MDWLVFFVGVAAGMFLGVLLMMTLGYILSGREMERMKNDSIAGMESMRTEDR